MLPLITYPKLVHDNIKVVNDLPGLWFCYHVVNLETDNLYKSIGISEVILNSSLEPIVIPKNNFCSNSTKHLIYSSSTVLFNL